VRDVPRSYTTLVTVLTRSVWFRARVTVLLLFEAPFCEA
jgi:hypothetical protein